MCKSRQRKSVSTLHIYVGKREQCRPPRVGNGLGEGSTYDNQVRCVYVAGLWRRPRTFVTGTTNRKPVCGSSKSPINASVFSIKPSRSKSSATTLKIVR